MALDEQEIQFKKKARRRLVGAIALVLLMVTILPMVLDDRSANLSQQEIDISIPSQDGDEFSSDITPYVPDDMLAEEEVPVSTELSNLQDPTQLASEPEVAETVPPVTEKAETAAPTSTAPTATPAPVVTKPVDSKPASGPTYSVQIGVFSDAGNVKQLEDKLKASGFKTSTEKIPTAQGEKIRLRAGPFANRALAEEAFSRIKDAGLSGMIITNK